MAQSHVVQTRGFEEMGKKYKDLSRDGLNSANTKLIQRLASLESDIIEDVLLHPEFSDPETNKRIIESLTTSDWCDATCNVLSRENFLPVKVEETILQTAIVVGPYCEWNCDNEALQNNIQRMQTEWETNKDDFDGEHFQQLQDLSKKALESLSVK